MFSLLSHTHLQSKTSEVSFTEMKNGADYVKQFAFTSIVKLDKRVSIVTSRIASNFRPRCRSITCV